MNKRKVVKNARNHSGCASNPADNISRMEGVLSSKIEALCYVQVSLVVLTFQIR